MTFPYVQYDKFYRPIVPVTFVVGDQRLNYEALIDTGADYSVVDREIGLELGLSFERAVPAEVVGIAGSTAGHIVLVDIELAGAHLTQVPVIFADLGPRSFGILGHGGLFDRFRLTIEFAKREFQIVPSRRKR